MDDPREAVSRYRLQQALRADARENGEEVADDIRASKAPSVSAAASGPTPPLRGAVTAAERAVYVENAIQQAIRRGEFDNLPLAGKPLEGLGEHHDPDWWIRRKIESEQLRGLGPPALTLRVEAAELPDRLDALSREQDVRDEVDDFNRRVVEARRQLLGGPPVVTSTRDADAEVAGWHDRRAARARAVAREGEREGERRARRRWWAWPHRPAAGGPIAD